MPQIAPTLTDLQVREQFNTKIRMALFHYPLTVPDSRLLEVRGTSEGRYKQLPARAGVIGRKSRPPAARNRELPLRKHSRCEMFERGYEDECSRSGA